jgi:predicted RNA-binding protein with RPS1 domain
MRDRSELSNREALVESLKGVATETQIRQAIGYLRIFESSQPLDGTMIHPDDYRLAERLVATGELSMPPSAPANWMKPTRPSSDAKPEPTEASAALSAEENPSEDSSEQTSPPESAPAEAEPMALATDVDVATVSLVAPEASTDGSEVSPVPSVQPESTATPAEAEPPALAASIDVTPPAEAEPMALATGVDVDPNVIPSFTNPKLDADGDADSASRKQNAEPKSAPSLAPINPENPSGPAAPVALTIDVEKLSRSWQVGREKTRFVGRSLQQPFADSRDFRMPIPLLTSMPTMETLRPGQTVWGIVIGVADFGAFMDLGPDCNGLVHVSRLSREFVEDPQEVVQIGDLIQVWVLHVDLEKRRIALSALPPGVEQARRPGSFDSPRDDNRREGRYDGNNRDQAQGGRFGGGTRASDNRAGGNRAGSQTPSQQPGGQPSQGQRPATGFGGNRGTGQGAGGPGRSGQGSGQGSGAGRGGQGGGNRQGYGRGNPSRDRSDSRDEVRAFNKKQDKPAKPAPPISNAMKEGKEPMRSFSDLIQFMQPKRTEPLPAVVTQEPVKPVASDVPVETNVEGSIRAQSVLDDAGTVANDAVQPAIKQAVEILSEDSKIASEPAE